MQHSHSVSGSTTFNKGHIHHFGEVTALAASGVPHVHILKGVSTFNLSHDHVYETKTGPAIFLANGLHYHYFTAKLQLEKGHIHYISGFTSAD